MVQVLFRSPPLVRIREFDLNEVVTVEPSPQDLQTEFTVMVETFDLPPFNARGLLCDVYSCTVNVQYIYSH